MINLLTLFVSIFIAMAIYNGFKDVVLSLEEIYNEIFKT